jgi:molybdate transport system substrate-binding protein
MRVAIVHAATAAATLWLAAVAGCGQPSEQNARPEVVVFAAASTTDVLTEIARDFEAREGVTVRLSFAGSSTLAKQIDAGAPAELFLSANPEWMDYVQQRGRLADGSRRDLLANRLVLIAPHGKGFPVRMEPGFDLAAAFGGRLALGDPTHVPAGEYAKAALQHMGWWDALADRLAPGADVRAALRYVEMGEAAAGVVYATDAASSDRVELLATFPADSHPPIRYPVALCKQHTPAAEAFGQFLQTPQAAEVFKKHGFEVLSG